MANNPQKKQELLFLSRTLGRAGVGVSLVAVLKNIDYSRFNVTLGIQFPIKELEIELPKEVKVVYYGEITSKLYQKIFDFNLELGKRKHNPLIRLFWHLLNKLEDCRMLYKIKKCFKKKYDTANAYHQGVASKYVIKHIRARKKILWYHSSVIEYPWYQKVFAKSDTIIVSTENGRKIMVDAWGQNFSKKIEVLPCLIPFEDIIAKSNAIVKFDHPKKFFILTCGRLSYEKGMDLAIEAAKYVKEKTDEFLWLILGEGPERKRLEDKISELGLSNNIKLWGRCENPYPLFRLCDIYVSPSRLENYGLTIVEALIFGKVVVTTRTIGGTTTIKNDYNGLYADIDAKSIAQKILTLMENEQLLQELKDNIIATDFVAIQNQHIETLNKLELCK